ncbi:hypothetical protein RclHR1_19370004 [Rhizophagus clarus]|uniref:RRM domain-containing protein n=1 Tax=Rhizophagus clarus TaxID=94130 RepID=A0A2Z6QNJ3_9GLOM|nr:hypothetical protein RclHR1_19370004 [Rhizophagus clarus]
MDVDPKLNPQQVKDKPVDEPEIIILSDDEDSFVLIPKLFTIYTESNNLPHVRKTDKAHEVLKLLQKYPGNEDSYNKVMQAKFHSKFTEEDQDGNLVDNNITFQFKSVMKEKLQKNEEEINNEKECTIQVFDIPLYTEKKTIQNSFSLLGEINKINTRAQRQYQQAYITYKDANSVQRFYLKWFHFISKEYVRVMPILLLEEQTNQRIQHSLKLSGLSIETKAINLKPIIDEMNTMTCFIPRNLYHYKPFPYAYVNFKNEEDKEIALKKQFSIKQGKTDRTLFISDPTIKRNICNNCRNPDHLMEKSNAPPTNPFNKNNNNNQNKKYFKGKHPAQNNNPKRTAYHSQNNTTQNQDTNQQPRLNNQNKDLSEKQQQYLYSLVDNLVKILEVQITQQFTKLRSHIDQFGSTINQFRKEREERLKNTALVSGTLNPPKARSPTPSSSSPKNEKNVQNKRFRKGSDYEDSSSSEEEQIKNMLQTQRMLVQKVDQVTGGLQGMIESALQNFLGFVTSTTISSVR